MFYALYSKAFMLYILKYFVAFQFFHKKNSYLFILKYNFFHFQNLQNRSAKIRKEKKIVPQPGFELVTYCLLVLCSTYRANRDCCEKKENTIL